MSRDERGPKEIVIVGDAGQRIPGPLIETLSRHIQNGPFALTCPCGSAAIMVGDGRQPPSCQSCGRPVTRAFVVSLLGEQKFALCIGHEDCRRNVELALACAASPSNDEGTSQP